MESGIGPSKWLLERSKMRKPLHPGSSDVSSPCRELTVRLRTCRVGRTRRGRGPVRMLWPLQLVVQPPSSAGTLP